jgi:hypothetical protein
MIKEVKSIRIFIASPSDLMEERVTLQSLIDEINKSLMLRFGLLFEPIVWERDVIPGAGNDSQDVINHQIPTDYEILIAMFWSRIGSPTKRAQSGTVEEFEKAYKRFLENNSSVHLMVYFKTMAIPFDKIESYQIEKLKSYKSSLDERGIFYSTFNDITSFEYHLRSHLEILASDYIKLYTGYTELKTSDLYKSLEEASVNKPEEKIDEGYLDLIQKNVGSSLRASSVMEHFTKELNKLTYGSNKTIISLQRVKNDTKNRLAVYSLITNKEADVMFNFVKQMQPEIDVFNESLYNSFNTFNKIIHIMPDFGNTEETRMQMRNLLSSLNPLIEAIEYVSTHTKELKQSIEKLPRITTKLISAKQELLMLIDALIVIFERGMSLFLESRTKGNKFLETLERDQDC